MQNAFAMLQLFFLAMQYKSTLLLLLLPGVIARGHAPKLLQRNVIKATKRKCDTL